MTTAEDHMATVGKAQSDIQAAIKAVGPVFDFATAVCSIAREFSLSPARHEAGHQLSLNTAKFLNSLRRANEDADTVLRDLTTVDEVPT